MHKENLRFATKRKGVRERKYHIGWKVQIKTTVSSKQNPLHVAEWANLKELAVWWMWFRSNSKFVPFPKWVEKKRKEKNYQFFNAFRKSLQILSRISLDFCSHFALKFDIFTETSPALIRFQISQSQRIIHHYGRTLDDRSVHHVPLFESFGERRERLNDNLTERVAVRFIHFCLFVCFVFFQTLFGISFLFVFYKILLLFLPLSFLHFLPFRLLRMLRAWSDGRPPPSSSDRLVWSFR